jgi:hypothetical protein
LQTKWHVNILFNAIMAFNMQFDKTDLC